MKLLQALHSLSIKKKLSLIVILSIFVTAIPVSAILVYYTKEKILSTEISRVLTLTHSQIRMLGDRFERSLPKLQGLAKAIQNDLMDFPVKPGEIDGFSEIMELNSDGIWRNKRATYDGSNESGIFLPDSPTLTDEEKITHIRIKQVIDHFGSASTEVHENVWFLSLLRSEIIFDRTFPEFAFEQQADNDYRQTTWVTYTSPEENPKKQLTFTPPLFDPVPRKWMVSALYPLYIGDKWVGSLGEDMQLRNVLAFMLEEQQIYPDTQHFLLDRDGNFVLAGQWQDELEATTSGQINLGGEDELTALLNTSLKERSSGFISDSVNIAGREYIAITMPIAAVGWQYFKLIPVDNIVAPASHLFYVLMLFVFLVSTICGGLISSAVNRNVISRIAKLSDFIRHYKSGDKFQVAQQISGNDEIAQAAQEFDVMAGRIDSYIKQVEQTRHELDETQQRWKFALEGAGDGVWDWNIATGHISYSPQCKKMLGYAEHELDENFKTYQSLIHHDDKAAVNEAITDYFNNKRASYTAEFRMLCRDGSWMWILSRGMVTQRDENDKPSRMIGTHTDISYLKQIQSEQLKVSERLRSMLMGSPIAVRIAGEHGHKVLFANRRYAELVNLPEQNILGIDPESFYAEPQDYRKLLTQIYSGQNITNRLTKLDVEGEGYKWAMASYSTISYEDQICVLGWFYDLTDHLKTEEALRLHASVFDNAWEGIVISDANNRIVTVNKAFTEITGYSQDDLLGKNPSLLASERQDKAFYEQMWKSLDEEGHWRGEIWNRKKSGESYAEILTISAVKDDTGKTTHYVGIFADITEMKKTERMLENMAHYDALTNLPNRSLLSDRLEQALARAERSDSILAVCFMDLDDFKPVNDRFGHETGDELLIKIANRLELNVRSGDTVARLGGDEFVILITQANSLEELDPILTRLIAVVSEEIKIDDHLMSVTASIGVAIYPSDNADAETLLRHADMAMYEAKQTGRNGYHIFNASLDQQMHERHMYIERVAEAILKQEFCLFYQPKVSLRTGKVVGMEALIRWQHPEKGILGPFEFLPYIEATDLIVSLGDWVIMQALAQVKVWQEAGYTIQVSVNLAARQVQEQTFIDKLDEALALYPSVDSNLLELEILETSALETSQTAQVLKATAKKLGVSFALDDFGTGYSSLAYLKQLSVRTLKIDQSFVRDVLEDIEDQAIVKGIIELAKVFAIDVIAEGVETIQHGEKLLEMGCEIVQGYGIARPMPAEEVIPWVESYTQQATSAVKHGQY